MNINDMKSMMTLLDLATRRSCWKVDELEHVGKVYNILKEFVDASEKEMENATAEAINQNLPPVTADEVELIVEPEEPDGDYSGMASWI